MKKKDQSIKHSDKKQKVTKGIPWWNLVKADLTRQEYGLAKPVQEAICEELRNWVKIPTSWDFQEFYNKMNVTRKHFDSVRKNYQMIEDEWQNAKDVLGERRQRMATFKEHNVNQGVVMFTLRKYHHDWQEIYDEDKALKESLADKGSKEPVIVKVERE